VRRRRFLAASGLGPDAHRTGPARVPWPPGPGDSARASPPGDTEVPAMYDGLRVADVVDGMDIVGPRNVGLVDARFQALWRNTNELDHQIHGIAPTVRYVPQERVVPNPIPADQFRRWESDWYDRI
jgi:hypothetical protein